MYDSYERGIVMKIFEMPEAEIVALEPVDIITTSDEWSSQTPVVWN